MTDKLGAIAFGTVAGPANPAERDLARRFHAAAIARGKAEAERERLPDDVPAAFRVRAVCKVAQTQIAWLRVYFEAIEHFKAERAAIVDGTASAAANEDLPVPQDCQARAVRHRPDTPSLQTPQGGDS